MAFRLLEEAHFLGQGDLLMDTRVHLWMLQLGTMRGGVREVIDQMARYKPFNRCLADIRRARRGGRSGSPSLAST